MSAAESLPKSQMEIKSQMSINKGSFYSSYNLVNIQLKINFLNSVERSGNCFVGKYI